jgi:hypothetical protein
VALVLEAFEFLVTEHSFAPGEVERNAGEVCVTFIRPPVEVPIFWADGELPQIRFIAPRGKTVVTYWLDTFIRGPVGPELDALFAHEHNPESLEYKTAFTDCLTIYVHILRTYGQPFLNGDLSQFKGVRPGQFMRARRSK